MSNNRRRTSKKPARGPQRRSKRKPSRWKLRLISSTLLLALALAVAGGGVLAWAVFPGPGSGDSVVLRVEPEWTAQELGEALQNKGVLNSPRLFALYSALLTPAVEVMPGVHLLNNALPARDVMQRLARLPSRPTVKVTIPEGWNHVQMAERLENAEVCPSDAFRSVVNDARLLERHAIPGASAEGYLFPATYELAVNTSAPELVSTMISETRERLSKLDDAHEGAFEALEEMLGFGEFEVLTLASIVEKETGRPEERPIVASVFFNRLTDPDFLPPKALQSDPTAAYGCLIAVTPIASCAGYDGRVRPAMLRDPNNPYNTYRHPGLPPGPIANPGEAAIEAVLSPAKTDYFYFVSSGAGGHVFSKDFEAHRAAVAQRRAKLGREDSKKASQGVDSGPASDD